MIVTPSNVPTDSEAVGLGGEKTRLDSVTDALIIVRKGADSWHQKGRQAHYENTVCLSQSTGDGKIGKVRFLKKTTYYHPIILGDSPSVSPGTTPVTIDWNNFSEETTPIPDIETDCHLPTTAKGRSKIPAQERFRLVRGAGHSMREISKAKSTAAVLHKVMVNNVRNNDKILSDLRRDLRGKPTKQQSKRNLFGGGRRS